MFPQPFIDSLKQSLGEIRAELLLNALDGEPSVSVRINPAKIADCSILNLPFDEDGAVPLSKYGYFLKQRPSFTTDPLLHGGCYYVQEASSMAIELLFASLQLGNPIPKGLRFLDLCAAPGGKSTHLLSMMRECPDSLLVSNEVIRQRATILSENIAKWGSSNVIVTNNDPSDFSHIKEYFDVVLADTPCSGEGMFRKDKNARAEWSLDNVAICASRQRRIVSDIWESLKPGGLMVYSTCTFNRTENEENVEWIINNFDAEVLVVQRFYPGNNGCGEGFFMAIIRKGGVIESSPLKFGKRTGTLSVGKYEKPLGWLKEGYRLILKDNLLKGYPETICDEMLYLQSKLRCIRSGVAIATVKAGRGKSEDVLIPEAELALSEALNPEAFPKVELGTQDALKFLTKESLLLHDKPIGYLLLTYKNVPLGFVKNLGNRSNNLWPVAWRIRTYQKDLLPASV